jgi:hypothetical protein
MGREANWWDDGLRAKGGENLLTCQVAPLA